MANTSKKKAPKELSAKWLRFIDRGVREGRFQSRQDAIERALKLLEQRDREVRALVGDIRRKIDEGLAEADRGELIDSKTAFEYVRKRTDRVRSRKSA